MSADLFRPGPYRVETVMRMVTLYDANGKPIASGYLTPLHEREDAATFGLLAGSPRLLAASRRLLDYLESLGFAHQPPALALAEAVSDATRDPLEARP